MKQPPRIISGNGCQRWLCTMALIGVFLPSVAWADRIRGFEGGALPVSAADMGSKHAQNKGREGYIERWVLRVDRDDGGWMQISYVITNLGPGSGRVVVDIMRLAPSLDNDKPERVFKRRSKKHVPPNWTAKKDRLDLKFGPSWFRRKGRGFAGYAKAWDRHVEFTVKGQGVRWKPGDGAIHFPGKGIYNHQVLATRARIEGRERRKDDPWRPFSGTVTVEHAMTNLLPWQMAKNMIRFQGKAGPYMVHFQELTTPSMWEGEKFGWVVVTKGSKVVAESTKAVATVSKYRTAKTADGVKHRVPSRYRVEASTPTGPIVLDVKTRSNILVEDLLAALNRPVRMILQLVLQPVNVFDRAKVRLQLPGSEKKRAGKGMSLYSSVFGR